MKKRPESTFHAAAERQRLMGRTVKRPGSLDIKAAAYELLRKHERDFTSSAFVSLSPPTTCFFLFLPVSCPLVSVPAAVMGSSACDLACRHADGRVHRSAVALPELQRPPSERSEVDLYRRNGYFWTKIWSIPSLHLSPLSNTDPTLCGIERQRPGSLSSALGAQSHAPSFPALPRPSGVSPTGSFVFLSI